MSIFESSEKLTPEQASHYISVSFGTSNQPQKVTSLADALNRIYS
ncbi:hypothetical protein HMPREF0497_0852 [Lentilactobacillus buchneri ATCC 11577]|nr:hypothetical protein [Lentilactobacillus hilgardii]EEI20362.1 hypothetical protein HMPREF0497_0852 [Lentilactobacillus buchneri ATCC 11577]